MLLVPRGGRRTWDRSDTTSLLVGSGAALTGSEAAVFEAFLYDHYAELQQEFYEQDFTCPFLCEAHKNENEARAQGARVPRGVVRYPYTNRHSAQGYTKYERLKP